MAGKSDYLENKIVDYVFRGQAMPTNPVLWVALFTAAPTDATSGAAPATNEVTGAGYGRVKAAAGATQALSDWNGTQGNTTGASSGTGGATSNAAAITFGSPTANWGTITHFGIFDGTNVASGTNLLYWGTVTPNKTVNNLDPAPSFAIGALTVTED